MVHEPTRISYNSRSILDVKQSQKILQFYGNDFVSWDTKLRNYLNLKSGIILLIDFGHIIKQLPGLVESLE